ncbi:hypothetical protein QVD17_31416 [Tagetes erecta]|uniref:Uncharacterized protein n=1 Tax=Tagetes erecta TaxID=13708 RepID=A0AAD8K7H0_TARER|nr:hypothetical protein QVD17_31416 [Tagetes erecta]
MTWVFFTRKFEQDQLQTGGLGSALSSSLPVLIQQSIFLYTSRRKLFKTEPHTGLVWCKTRIHVSPYQMVLGYRCSSTVSSRITDNYLNLLIHEGDEMSSVTISIICELKGHLFLTEIKGFMQTYDKESKKDIYKRNKEELVRINTYKRACS